MIVQAENILVDTVKLSLGVGVVDLVGLNKYITNERSLPFRALKRGASWYVAEQAVEQLFAGDSNFTKMNTTEGWANLIDDTVYYGAVSGVMEVVNLPEMVYNLTSEVMGKNNASAYVATGLLLAGAKKLSYTVLGNSTTAFIRNISSTFL